MSFRNYSDNVYKKYITRSLELLWKLNVVDEIITKPTLQIQFYGEKCVNQLQKLRQQNNEMKAHIFMDLGSASTVESKLISQSILSCSSEKWKSQRHQDGVIPRV